MKKILIILAVGIFVAMASSVYAVETFQTHTGVILWDEANAMNGYTLFAPSGETVSYLIDMEGYIVHSWDVGTTPGLHDRLLVDGNLLRGYRPGVPGGFNPRIGGAAGGVREYTWDNEMVWDHVAQTATSIQHHTFFRVETGPQAGTTFILAWEFVSCEDAFALGRNEGTCDEGVGLGPDWIYQINMDQEVIWSWRVWDHVGEGPNQFAINAQTDPVNQSNQDWTHGNTVEYDHNSGMVIFNSRNWGEFFLIDHAGTFVEGDPAQSIANAAGPAGDIMFRWGNPCNYGAGDCPRFNDDGDQEIFGEHCVVFLGTGDNVNFGDYGNILIFDNGWQRSQGNRSRSVEVAPDMQDWLATEVVWTYQSGDQGSFYTAYQGGTQRLANGNTFITSTGEGHLFQVTPGGSVVWDFVNPRRTNGVAQCWNFDNRNSSIHRAHQYSPDYPGLAGKDLSRKGHIVGNCTQIWNKWEGEPGDSAGFRGEMNNFLESPGVRGVTTFGGGNSDYTGPYTP